MENEEKRSLIIEQYIQGELQENQLDEFLKEVLQDKELKEDVEVQAFLKARETVQKKKRFKGLVKEHNLQIDKPNLSVVDKDEDQQDNAFVAKEVKVKPIKEKQEAKTSWLNSSLLRVAASVLLFAVIGLLVFQYSQSGSSPQQLAQVHLVEHYNAPTILRNSTENVEENWQKAITAYKKEDFVQSATLIEKVIQQGKANEEQFYYLGLSYLYQDKELENKAIKNFDKVRDSLYLEAAQWYKGLALIKLGKEKEAKELLLQLQNTTDQQRKKKVEELLKALN